MRLFNFVVLSVITAPHNIPLLTLAKPICLMFHSNCIDAQKTNQGKREVCVGMEAQRPPTPSLKALRL